MRRLLVVVNTLIGILLLAVLVVVYWFLWRALPQTSGHITAGVSQPVEVDRDHLGSPHIRAKTIPDALFVQGYVTAEDRMWQMDGLRRFSGGELSEIVGPVALDTDKQSRSLRLRRVAEEIYAHLSDADKAPLDAYARGVNAYIDSHHGRYGLEFSVLQYDPRPWSAVDTLLVGLHMFRTLTNDFETKLVREKLLNSPGAEAAKVDYMYPVHTGLEFSPGGDIHTGSNAWAVAGTHTASGKPMLSNDMHLEYSLPNIWYTVHLTAPDLNVQGVSLPGVPAILSGHNDRIAWGLTNLEFDVQDLYAEKIDLRTGQYVAGDHLEQARQEREIIRIKGRPAEEISYWVTRHGPVSVQGNRAYSLKWTAAEPGVFSNPFLQVNQAKNWSEFLQAISRFGGPGQNFVYADVDGNIGYHATGKLPIRRNYYGNVPVDGASGQFEWDGYIPFEELPQAFNPANGYVVTANQNPFPADYPYHVAGYFASPHRSRQIFDMLAASGNKLKPEDSLRIEKDVYSEVNHFLAKQIASVYEKRRGTSPAFDQAAALLKVWNGQMALDRPEPLIATLVFNHLRSAVADRASPGNGALYQAQIASSVVEKLLRERPSDWFSDYDGLILRALADGIEEGQRLQGSDPAKWRWGKYRFLKIDSPVGGKLPLVGEYFNIGPLPLSGGSTSVKQTNGRIGPSERMNYSLANWDDSLMNLPIGESGHRLSVHYKDQFDAYYNGTSFPLEFGKVNVKSTVTFEPEK